MQSEGLWRPRKNLVSVQDSNPRPPEFRDLPLDQTVTYISFFSCKIDYWLLKYTIYAKFSYIIAISKATSNCNLFKSWIALLFMTVKKYPKNHVSTCKLSINCIIWNLDFGNNIFKNNLFSRRKRSEEHYKNHFPVRVGSLTLQTLANARICWNMKRA